MARGGSKEYPQSMFKSKNKKSRYTPAYPSFAIQKSGLRSRTCFPDAAILLSTFEKDIRSSKYSLLSDLSGDFKLLPSPLITYSSLQ